MSNRLAKETSPYLLQHKNNPVEWYPWGQEALHRSKKENKPILLSVGYSACHWCHVMEHECFENAQIAQLMNENFINIKVDREERPDLDQIYQNVTQALTGSGGWPLTVFLTPELKPFFGGTYFPPEDRYGRPGFPRVLTALSHAFRSDRKSVEENAVQLTEAIASSQQPSSRVAEMGEYFPTEEKLKKSAESILERVDWKNGGLGGAPKFPNTMSFSYLWRYGLAYRNIKAQEATLLTLTKIASGGIFDHLGGGFHRYSVDATWSVPHFEKMLYDNALLLKLFAEVLLSQERSILEVDQNLYLDVLQNTVEYVLREMTAPEGGFFSAQDADSEGEEGKFFVWDLEEISKILSENEARAFATRYGIEDGGNFEHGKTVLFLSKSLPEVAQEIGRDESEVREWLESARRKLFSVRKKRIAPGLDNKVITSWNALMISGLVWAAQALSHFGRDGEKAERAAKKAFEFLTKNLAQKEGRLSSTFQGGVPKGNAYLDDYAFAAMAALDVARFSKDQKEIQTALGWSRLWVQQIHEHFNDSSKNPGYFFTSDDHETLIHRPKNLFDQAIPGGTAVAMTCMQALLEIGLPEGSSRQVELQIETEFNRQLGPLFYLAERSANGMSEMLCAGLLHVQGPKVISGAKASELCHDPSFFQKLAPVGMEDAYLVCHRRTCTPPVKTLEEALKLLSG